MRSTLASLMAAGLSLGLALTVTPAVVGSASAVDSTASASTSGPATRTTSDREAATQALERAQALFSDKSAPGRDGSGTSTRQPKDATLALRDLFSSLGDLSPAQRKTARGILARPTDGPADGLGDGYLVPAVKKCKGNFCMHWVTSTVDAPPSSAWAAKMLRLMNKVWKKEVGKLGYRPPVSDGGRGGNGKFDVYLAQIGDGGLYGYCAPERRKPGFRWLASGYCVLDNDMAEFPLAPMQSAEVTAAHEFFHAIQFAYDYGEDAWLLEATATWMEERVFDDVNDNRQYLPAGQVGPPYVPLDYFNPSGEQYGNWTFFEFLSKNFGNGVVKPIWNKAAAFPGAPDQYSTKAIAPVLKPKGGFKKVYSRVRLGQPAAREVLPRGQAWTSPRLDGRLRPSAQVRAGPASSAHTCCT